MKRLLGKVQTSKPFAALPKTLAGFGLNMPLGSSAPGHTPAHTVGLKPKYLVPPIPHPCPYDHLALLVTKEGLLIRQHIPGHDRKTGKLNSYVRIAWGKPVQVEEVVDSTNAGDVDWSDSVIVYGIIGVLELFSGADNFISTQSSVSPINK